jgi:hypothetical protein
MNKTFISTEGIQRIYHDISWSEPVSVSQMNATMKEVMQLLEKANCLIWPGIEHGAKHTQRGARVKDIKNFGILAVAINAFLPCRACLRPYRAIRRYSTGSGRD